MFTTKYMKYRINFWNKVEKRLPDECWPWIGGTNLSKDSVKARGAFWVGKHISAHRFSWEIHLGDIPPNRIVLHKCDNRLCVNPQHLYLGTYSDNNKDRAHRNPHNQGGIPKWASIK